MAQSYYRYTVTLTPTAVPGGGAVPETGLTFTAVCHDDIPSIVARTRQSTGLEEDLAAQMAVGLKLLSEVVLIEKTNPLFDPLRGAIREFIGGLKSRIRG